MRNGKSPADNMVFMKSGVEYKIWIFVFFSRKKPFPFTFFLILAKRNGFCFSSVKVGNFVQKSPLFMNTFSVTRNRHWTIRALNKIRTWINKKKLNPDQICMKTRSEFTFCLTDWKKSELTQHEFSITTAFHSKKLTENVRE